MTNAGLIILIDGGSICLTTLLTFVLDNERLPGQYLRWSVYQAGTNHYNNHGDHGIVIGIRRRSAKVPTGFVAANSPTFDDDLIAAIDAAREKALILNAQTRSIRRRLP